VAAVGTLAWAAATGGRLTWPERLGLVADAVALQVAVLPTQVRWKLGLGPERHAALDPHDIRPPDTSAARAAETVCREVSAPWLVNHCLRAYCWGRILGAQKGLKPDDEVFYVACLLHDLGLTPRYAAGPTDPPCFAVRGAGAAREFARGAGLAPTAQERVAEAITLHVNVTVGLEHGPEAHLLNVGTALDVTGLRYWELPEGAADAIVARYPRLDMKRLIWDVWKAEADAHPECRGSFLNQFLQFGSRVRSAPFNE
jgi:HD domain-containing protein